MATPRGFITPTGGGKTRPIWRRPSASRHLPTTETARPITRPRCDLGSEPALSY